MVDLDKALKFLKYGAMGVGALLAILLVSPASEKFIPVATIIEAEGCQWAGSDLPTA